VLLCDLLGKLQPTPPPQKKGKRKKQHKKNEKERKKGAKPKNVVALTSSYDNFMLFHINL